MCGEGHTHFMGGCWVFPRSIQLKELESRYTTTAVVAHMGVQRGEGCRCPYTRLLLFLNLNDKSGDKCNASQTTREGGVPLFLAFSRCAGGWAKPSCGGVVCVYAFTHAFADFCACTSHLPTQPPVR